MPVLFYVRLVGFTVGALVYLFLLALIIGHRRPRLFERLLFFLVFSLFLLYSGGLLEINARMQYTSAPEATRLLYTSLITLGFLFLSGLLVHVHLQYYRLLRPSAVPGWCVVMVSVFYALPFLDLLLPIFTFRRLPTLNVQSLLYLLRPQDAVGIISAILICAVADFYIAKASRDLSERRFFYSLCTISIVTLVPLALWQGFATLAPNRGEAITTALVAAGILPGALLIYYALRRNFLEFGAQRNLVYALSATFLALLYLALVRRVGGWLEPILPPEATASILLFVLIFLFEPVERLIGPALHRTIRQRIDRMQQLMVEVQVEARSGDIGQLIDFTGRRLRDAFGLADVKISVPVPAGQEPLESPGGLGHVVRVPILQDGATIGLIEASSTGAVLTGEVSASLSFVAEQLPAAIDLCRLIGEKLKLERELAERERLALVGQMAASISHNLRNPLGSMKTVLQVLLEKPDLPQDIHADCALVVAEIDRLSAKLRQLLQYAKPSLPSAAERRRVAALAAIEQVIALLGREAERRQGALELVRPADEVYVFGSEEALNDVVSNLVVNAIEALPHGGKVRVSASLRDGRLAVEVEDNGPGISPDSQKRIFQPFFTTKASGTGLGLAIVERRLAEMGGSIEWESPIRDGRGTRFTVTFLLAELM